MKKLLLAVFTAGFCMFASYVVAVASDQHEAEGVVKQIKSDVKKITISHGPIKSLGMDGMTMDFPVYDPAMLDEVQEGHMISFVLEEDKSGNLVIMDLEDKGVAKGDMGQGGDHHHHHNSE
jgi:Cu(I)/Ag(I) efflux system protein CusF